jgi:hypothetical protein
MLEGIDVQAVATAVVGIGGFVAAVWAGIRNGLNKTKSNDPDGGAKIVGGVLMDNTSMLMLSEAVKDNTEAVYRLRDDVRENSHQVERLRDKL